MTLRVACWMPFFVLSLSQHAWAWGPKDHRAIAAFAIEHSPPGLSSFLEENRDEVLRGAVDPDRKFMDTYNHTYEVDDGTRDNPDHVAYLSAALDSMARSRAPRENVAYWIGALSHYVSDIDQPLHTSDRDKHEGWYHLLFEGLSYGLEAHAEVLGMPINVRIGKALSGWQFHYDGCNDPIDDVRAWQLGNARWASRYYDAIRTIYAAKGAFQGARLVEIYQTCIDEAANDVVDLWAHIHGAIGLELAGLPRRDEVLLVEVDKKGRASLDGKRLDAKVLSDAFGQYVAKRARGGSQGPPSVHVEIDDRCGSDAGERLRQLCGASGITHLSTIRVRKGPLTSRLGRAVKAHVTTLTSAAGPTERRDSRLWKMLASYAQPPDAMGPDGYRSPLLFDDGQPVKDAQAWPRRRQEILERWQALIGRWPPLLDKPGMEPLSEERRGCLTLRKVKVEAASDLNLDGYLLLPEGPGPFPAVLVVYYEPETSAGLKGEAGPGAKTDTSPGAKTETEQRDFGYQLALRGFVTLSIGWPRNYTDASNPRMQTLSTLAYIAANCRRAMAALREVDPQRIGVCGHSFGGKWALFATAFCEDFACGAWSDPGIVFDESRPNVNYWEPWYLGWEEGRKRKPGVPTADNPRTGAYAKLVAEGRDLHEILSLIAPRPFLVSGGSEDPPERWKALRHVVEVNRILGHEGRVFMTNRSCHSPTAESNEILYAFFEHFIGRRG